MGAIMASRIGINGFLRAVAQSGAAAVRVVQSAVGSGSSTNTLTLSLANSVTSKRLVIAALGVDKSATSFTTPTGWTQVGAAYIQPSVSQAVFYRITDGSSTDQSVTMTIGTNSGLSGLLAEINLSNPTLGEVDVSPNSDSTVTSVALTSGSAVSGVALAFCSVDSRDQNPWTDLSFTNSYTSVLTQGGVSNNGLVATGMGARNVAAGDSFSTTATTGTTDQTTLRIVNFGGTTV